MCDDDDDDDGARIGSVQSHSVYQNFGTVVRGCSHLGRSFRSSSVSVPNGCPCRISLPGFCVATIAASLLWKNLVKKCDRVYRGPVRVCLCISKWSPARPRIFLWGVSLRKIRSLCALSFGVDLVYWICGRLDE